MSSSLPKRAAAVLEWVVAGGIAGWAVARLLGLDRVRRTQEWATPMLSFTPQVTAAAWPAAWLLRGPARRRTAALAAAALTAVVVPRALPRRQPAGASGPVLRVLTANVLVGRAAATSVVDLVARTSAHVLLVQELTDDAVAELAAAGLTRLLPHQLIESVAVGPRGNAIYARYPLTAWPDGPAGGPDSPCRPAATLELPSGHLVRIGCVHTRAPSPARAGPAAAIWRDELESLPAPGPVPVILAGDFNATLDHALFRALLRRGYRDAARQSGAGLVPTWGPRTGGHQALLALDHVLADTRCAVQSASVHRLPGTDHRAVCAVLRLPA